VEAKFLRHVLLLVYMTIAIADRVERYSSLDELKLREEQGENTSRGGRPITVRTRGEVDLLELCLELLVNRMGKKVGRVGLDGSARPLLARLLEYKLQNESQDEVKVASCYERFIGQLELNELLHQRDNILKKWEKLKFCVECLVLDVEVIFDNAGYL